MTLLKEALSFTRKKQMFLRCLSTCVSKFNIAAKTQVTFPFQTLLSLLNVSTANSNMLVTFLKWAGYCCSTQMN